MGDDRDAMRELNAQPEEIERNFRRTLLLLMRAVCSQEENTDALWEANQCWQDMRQGLADCKEPPHWRDIFTRAVRSFRKADHKGDEVDYALREVARTGMSVYIEDTEP